MLVSKPINNGGRKLTDEQRFWTRSMGKDSNGCWIWCGKKNARGYGIFMMSGGKPTPAHRYSYTILRNEVPKNLVMDHLCRNHSCINPYHLEPVTQKVNCERGDAGKHLREKTHCKNGHEFTKENTYIRSCGKARTCRICQRDYALKSRRKKSPESPSRPWARKNLRLR